MSETKQEIPEEQISDAPSDTGLLFTESEQENLDISSGKKDQTTSNVKIETNIVNSVLRYMVVKSQAWSTMEQAFIHFSMLFMTRDWHGENDLATKINESFKDAPFTVATTKKCLQKLADLKVIDKKVVKGKNKYKITDMGISMIIHDRVLAKTLGMDKPPTTNEQTMTQTEQPQDNAQTSAELTAQIGPKEEPKLEDNTSPPSPKS